MESFTVATFVGRVGQLGRIDELWDTTRVFCFCGPSGAGKTRLAEEVERRVKQRCQNHEFVFLDLRKLTDSGVVWLKLASKFKLLTGSEQAGYEELVMKYLTLESYTDKKSVVVMDNIQEMDDKVTDEFLQIVQRLASDESPQVKVILTSQMRYRFLRLGERFHEIDLPYLTVDDSMALLKIMAPNVEFGDSLRQIAEKTAGLPMAVVMAGAQLREDSLIQTPGEYLLSMNDNRLDILSPEVYHKDEQIERVVGNAIDRLNNDHKKYLREMNYIPGSFSPDAAREVLGFDESFKAQDRALKPLYYRNILQVDKERRLDIHSLPREYLDRKVPLVNESEVRTRYVSFFGRLLKDLQNAMDTKDSASTAIASIVTEQPNLIKLLQKAMGDPVEVSYDTCLSVAKVAENVIQGYLPKQDAIDFYRRCAEAAESMADDTKDAGIMLTSYGRILNNTQNDHRLGMDKFIRAKRILVKHGPSRELAKLYQHMAWSHNSLGENESAVRYIEKAYQIETDLELFDDPLTLQTLNSLGIFYTAIGDYANGERFHFKALETRRRVLGDHPSIGSVYNNLGLMYNLKGDYENAIKYYEKGLEEKRRFCKGLAGAPLIPSLNNVADQYTRRRNYQRAIELLNEALQVHDTIGQKNTKFEALTLDTLGQTYIAAGMFLDAVRVLERGVPLRQKFEPKSAMCFESLAHLAEAYMACGSIEEAISKYKEALDIIEDVIQQMPKWDKVPAILIKLANAYLRTNQIGMANGMFGRAIKEYERIACLHKKAGDVDLLKLMVDRALEVRACLARNSTDVEDRLRQPRQEADGTTTTEGQNWAAESGARPNLDVIPRDTSQVTSSYDHPVQCSSLSADASDKKLSFVEPVQCSSIPGIPKSDSDTAVKIVNEVQSIRESDAVAVAASASSLNFDSVLTEMEKTDRKSLAALVPDVQNDLSQLQLGIVRSAATPGNNLVSENCRQPNITSQASVEDNAAVASNSCTAPRQRVIEENTDEVPADNLPLTARPDSILDML